MDKEVSQYYEKEILSPLQQRVADYYDEHPGSSRLDCAKAIYGTSNPFTMQNLSNLECTLRKKGYLFYSIYSRVIDMARDDVDIDLRMKVQRRAGRSMIGQLKSNIRLIQVAKDDRLLEIAKLSFKESLGYLVQADFIKLNEINQTEIESKVDNTNQLLLL